MNTWIIVPGLNEEKRIVNVVKDLKKRGFENILFVDDGSKDDSLKAAKKAGAKTLKHLVNLGKGAASKTGCDYALKQGAKILVLMDADGQHKPEDVSRLISELKKTKSDIVFGYRDLNKEMPFVMRLGNLIISKTTLIFNGINIKDTQSGFRCMTSSTYRKIRWKSNDYSMESEMISNVSKKKLKYSEIPIKTIYKDKFKGTTIFDGIKIFINILRFRIFGGLI